MNTLPPDLSKMGNDEEGFSVFPSGPKGSPGEGRDPHALLKEDPLASQFPTERQIGIFLFLASLVLYLASMSWSPFPGLPTRMLLMHLGMETAPSTLDSLWGWLVRLFAHLPGLSVAGWAGLFSALCGATCVGLLGRLMVRVGYLIRNEPGPSSFIREAQARRLSGLVAGLYLACCIPFWVISTRSLPGTFHLLLLLAAAWFFSQYQHWGKLRHLGLLGLFYGLGITEFATFIVFLPLVLFLVSREMFRWRALSAWRAQLMIWGGLLLGLALYPFNAKTLFWQGVATGVFSSSWLAWGRILQEQALLITQVRYSPGFLVIMFLTLVPWLTLFAMSRRSPWFYEGGQVAVRLIFVGGLLGVLFNASFAPWTLLGMSYVMVTPYLLLAVCMGYMAGEFWILGEIQGLGEPTFAQRIIRRARRVSSVFALLLPIAILAGGATNWRTVNGRHGGIVLAAAQEVLDRLGGRDILFSTGFLDDSLRLAVWAQKTPVQLISAPRISSPLYLRRLAGSFTEDDILWRPLLQDDFGMFLDNLMMSDRGPSRTCIIDMPDVFREYGHLVPDGFLYRLETSADRVDLSVLIESQRPFWARMEQMALHPIPEANLIRPYQDMLRLLASKVANNLGVMQVERGDQDGALETFRTARRIYPENLSVMLNLMELSRTRTLPEAAELEKKWEASLEKLKGERWALGIRFGYVWHAREWIRRGWVWVLSGAPATVEAARRNPPATEDEVDQRVQILDQAYLLWGLPPQNETYYLSLLMQEEKDTSALMAMCRLALRRNDPEAAEAYIQEALAMGLPEEGALFDRAMVAYVRGENTQALELLGELTRQTPGDMRVWMALILLTDEKIPLNELAMKTLKNKRALGIGARLALAQVHLTRQQWAEAQAELEQAVQTDSRNTQAWEMLVTLSQLQGNQKLMGSSLRALIARKPDHFLQYQNEGVDQYKKGQLVEAEASFRAGIQHRRDPTLLNNIAQIIMERGGDLQEALELLNEALRRNPGNAGILGTRGTLYVKLGRFQEARTDLQESLQKQGRNNNLLLPLAQSYEQLGDRAKALKVAIALAKHPDQLNAEQKQQVKKLLIRLRRSQNINRLLPLAQSYEQSGDRAKAMKVAIALAKHPDQLNAEQKQQVKQLLLNLRQSQISGPAGATRSERQEGPVRKNPAR